MEKRIGIVAMVVTDTSSVPRLNTILSEYSHIIDARLGLPMRDKGISLISLVVEGTTDTIGALTGRIGRLPGVKVKSVLTTHKEHDDVDGTRESY